jgi:DNA-directed RNA polymerase subunit H (RpoH/RPB5)
MGEELRAVYKNVILMLEDRGYNSRTTEKLPSIEDFVKGVISNNQRIVVVTSETSITAVFFTDNTNRTKQGYEFLMKKTKISMKKEQFNSIVSKIQDVVNPMIKDSTETIFLIIVSNAQVTKFDKPKNLFKHSDGSIIQLEYQLFSYSFFHIAKPHHELQPEFILIRAPKYDDSDAIVRLVRQDRENMQKMKTTDPIVLWYNARTGDIFKIKDRRVNTISSMRYRIVSDI